MQRRILAAGVLYRLHGGSAEGDYPA